LRICYRERDDHYGRIHEGQHDPVEEVDQEASACTLINNRSINAYLWAQIDQQTYHVYNYTDGSAAGQHGGRKSRKSAAIQTTESPPRNITRMQQDKKLCLGFF
jgi:hypothetical protein